MIFTFWLSMLIIITVVSVIGLIVGYFTDSENTFMSFFILLFLILFFGWFMGGAFTEIKSTREVIPLQITYISKSPNKIYFELEGCKIKNHNEADVFIYNYPGELKAEYVTYRNMYNVIVNDYVVISPKGTEDAGTGN